MAPEQRPALRWQRVRNLRLDQVSDNLPCRYLRNA